MTVYRQCQTVKQQTKAHVLHSKIRISYRIVLFTRAYCVRAGRLFSKIKNKIYVYIHPWSVLLFTKIQLFK